MAGLLEGEGYFGLSYSNKYPKIVLQMTDLDIIIHARDIINRSINIKTINRKNWKTIYKFTVNGIKAVEWMMTVFPLMGHRRQSKIQEALVGWKAQTGHKTVNQITSAKGRIVLDLMRLGLTK